MRALQFIRSVPRFLAVRALARRFPAVATGPLGSLRLGSLPPLALPGDDWVRIRPRLSGICGSDLATITCQGSYYFSALTSFPFVLGHEVVGDVVEAGSRVTTVGPGTRVVLEPALGCRVRAVSPLCPACAAGQQANCLNVAGGALAAGVQTGYCRDTGGGFSNGLVAHASQVHPVPAALTDEAAVLVEPLACAIHVVLAAGVSAGDQVLILGAGSVGLLALYALKRFAPRCQALVAARYPHQAELARTLGADEVLPSGAGLRDAVIARTGARRHEPEIGDSVVLGGVDVTFDCVGSAATIGEAVRLTRARGTVLLAGMPGVIHGLEGTALWYKETRLTGAYAYGLEKTPAGDRRTFDLAIEAAAAEPGTLARLVTSRHRLDQYRTALGGALRTGRSRGVKTVFDLR